MMLLTPYFMMVRHTIISSLEAGSNQSNVTCPLPDEENMHAFQNYACNNSLLQCESNNESIARLLNEAIGTTENPLPFSA